MSQPTARYTPLDVGCRKCYTGPDRACVTTTGKFAPYFHTSRIFDAMKYERENR